VATSARQQQHRQALSQACEVLNGGSQRADSCIAARAASVSPAPASSAARVQQQPKDNIDVALMAAKLLAEKLAAIASMHYLFAGSQVYNTHLRTLQGGSGAAAAAAASGSGGVDGAADNAGGGNGGSPLLTGLQARPLQQQAHPGQQVPGGNGGRGVGGMAAGADAAPNESGTQNSASSAVELMPPPAAVGSAASAQIEVAAAVEQYIHLAGRWEKVAAANEKFMRQVGLQRGVLAAGVAADAAGADDPLHLELPATPAGSGNSTGSSEALQHKVGQLVLAVGFEMGMWDLLSVLATASQACQAVKELVGAG
jgi:hypothetical protein